MVSMNRSFCEETENPIMFSGAVPKVPEVLHSSLWILFCSDRACDCSTGEKNPKQTRISTVSCRSCGCFLWHSSLAWVSKVDVSTGFFRWCLQMWQIWHPRYERKENNHRHAHRSGGIYRTCFSLHFFFLERIHWGFFFSWIALNECWDKHSCLRRFLTYLYC